MIVACVWTESFFLYTNVWLQIAWVQSPQYPYEEEGGQGVGLTDERKCCEEMRNSLLRANLYKMVFGSHCMQLY